MSEDRKSIGEEELDDLEQQADGTYAPNTPAGQSSDEPVTEDE